MVSYRIDSPHIVSEVFVDEEAAIINLKTGNYYSLNKTATAVWELIEKRASADDIAGFVANNFNVGESFETTEIEQFIQKLLDEGLIIAEESPALANVNAVNIENSPGVLKKREYESPILECYADMQELLLLDPIHEVEETNWLVNKPQQI